MKSSIKYSVFIDEDVVFIEAIQWTWDLVANYAQFEHQWVSKRQDAQVQIGYSEENNVRLSKSFWERIARADFGADALNQEFNEVNNDSFAAIFYLVNCLWEREEHRQKDWLGRSNFASSIWKEKGYGRPFLKVNQLLDGLCNDLHLERQVRKSQVFLSHDIDAVHSAWKEDGKAALKQGRIGGFIRLLLSKVRGNSSWYNFLPIAKQEREFGFTSTFYWLTTQKAIPGVGKNADYDLNSERMKNTLAELKALGSHHGIHKSIDSTTFKEELESMPIEVSSNRYHYLKFDFTELIGAVNDAGLKMDASLGYAEVYGYRNGFSLPFVPFDLKNKKPSNFVEVPLCLMDGTFSKYLKLSGKEAQQVVNEFIEEHAQNAIISVLWHNTHFTDYKYRGYPEVYQQLLGKLAELDIQSINPDEIIKQYS